MIGPRSESITKGIKTGMPAARLPLSGLVTVSPGAGALRQELCLSTAWHIHKLVEYRKAG